MDETIFSWFNHWNGRYELVDDFLKFSRFSYMKTVPFMLAVWALWFIPKIRSQRTRTRESLSAALLCTLPLMVVTRAIANNMPFSARPLHTPGLEINLNSGQSIAALDGWSSMPSDHASLFIGFSVAIFRIHRGFGVFLLFWAVLIVSLPRIVLGYHWPSDIIAGALIGTVLALMLISPLTRLVRKAGIISMFEANEMIGYPLLFLVTYEIAQMFALTRYLAFAIIE